MARVAALRALIPFFKAVLVPVVGYLQDLLVAAPRQYALGELYFQVQHFDKENR